MKGKFRIIIVAEDRGGFDAIFPVVKKIKTLSNFHVELILAGRSAELADKRRIKYSKVVDFKIKPDLVISGTSGGKDSIDKKAVETAKNLNIPTVSFVDFWSNYQLRFGKKGEFLPKYILVIDNRMRKEVRTYLKEKNKFTQVIITGSPRFDNLTFSNEGKCVVFYSQPLNGYEVDVFKNVIGIMEQLHYSQKVILKLHPNEKSEDKFLEVINRSKLNIRIENKLSVEELNKVASLVIGMDSIALFISCLMGKKTISYQPGKNKKEDFLASNEYGWSVPVYKKGDLINALDDILKRVPVRKKILEKYIKVDSTGKIINIIKRILKNK